MKVLGIIPARGGSKGIPRKNIKLLCGKPLLQYTAEDAEKSKMLSKVILSSEDAEIIEIAKKVGLEVPFVRPAELALDTTASIEVIQHALDFYESKNEIFDAVCLLQVTTPLRSPGLIDKAIQKFRNGGYDSMISVREVPAEYNPHWIFEENAEKGLKIATGEKNIISRRQDLPPAYYRDGAIYITKTDIIKHQNSLYGKKIGFINTSASPYINIDEPQDWQQAAELIKNLK